VLELPGPAFEGGNLQLDLVVSELWSLNPITLTFSRNPSTAPSSVIDHVCTAEPTVLTNCFGVMPSRRANSLTMGSEGLSTSFALSVIQPFGSSNEKPYLASLTTCTSALLRPTLAGSSEAEADAGADATVTGVVRSAFGAPAPSLPQPVKASPATTNHNARDRAPARETADMSGV
jgi:hypothetical protein